jgi:hypothetical protein
MELNRIYTIREVTLTALVHHLTPAVLNVLPALGYLPTGKGVYQQVPSAMESRLICFGALPDEVTPDELRAFSNPARRQSIILSELERGKLTPLLEAIVELYESEVFRIMAVKQETIKRYIEALGPEKFLAVLKKEDIVATLRKEDHLAALSKEDLVAALSKEDLLAALGKEKEEVLQYLLPGIPPDQLQRLLANSGHDKSKSH